MVKLFLFHFETFTDIQTFEMGRKDKEKWKRKTKNPNKTQDDKM
jgi:hypothetical protein